MRDLSAGLGFLWGKELVHRDIKPQNLLLTGELPGEEVRTDPPAVGHAAEGGGGTCGEVEGDAFMLKIADFGFARHLAGVDLAETMCGSPLYMAPEILMGKRYDAKADLWSVGTVLFEMIAGKPPFHGENHMDLLNNIQRKAVRLPADVRVSHECVKLLKILLDRKPATRADFKAFFEASDAFVALGCNGVPNNVVSSSDGANNDLRPLRAKSDLCAISENEGSGDSCEGNDQARQVYGVQTRRAQEPDPNSTQVISNIPKMVTSQTKHAIMQVRQDHMNRPGVVTPPFNPIPAPPPPALSTGLQEVHRHGGRPSVFAPLQGSPNISPSLNPGMNPPLLSLQDAPPGAGTNLTLPIPGFLQMRPRGDNAFLTMHRQQVSQALPINNQNIMGTAGNREDSHHTSSSRDTFDSGFVLVEHSGCRSRPDSGHSSPAASVARAHESSGPSSPNEHAQGNRVTILNARSGNPGLLSTSPGTGRALVGKMMGYPPGKSNLPAPPISSGGKFNVSPRSALRLGGCLAHIESLARMLAAAEDIGRRAITVAHLGDVRAYLAMGLLVAKREESQSSSRSSCTPMEGVEEEGGFDKDAPFAINTTRMSFRSKASKKGIVEEEDDDDEMPFAIAASSDGGSADEMLQSPSANILSQLAPIIGNNNSSENTGCNEEVTPAMIASHFREALMCYVKTLSMMKGSIRAAQKVMSDVDDVTSIPSAHPSPNSNNPYTPLKKRCATSLEWLSGQFSAVLERADAASEQIAKLQNKNPSQKVEGEPTTSVEELIYNHSLKCGREGAVKQLLGDYDAARSCYRSAGLLLETLLMEPKVGDDDRTVLEGYVQSFADQITELDGLIRRQVKTSRASSMHGQMGSAYGIRRQNSGTSSPKQVLS